MTPNGRMIYVADEGSSTVTPIDIPTNRACTDHHRRWPASHRLGLGSRLGLAGVRGEQHLRHADAAGYRDRAARIAGQRRRVLLSHSPTGMVITGSTGIVLDTCSGQVSLFSTRTRHVDAPITVGDFPVAVAISG